MYKYRLTEKVKADLFRIYEYGISRFGIIQADKYFDMFYDCFDKIESNPYLFPSADHVKKDFRFCVCGADTIYYKIIDNKIVEIVTIVGKQNYLNIH